MKSTFNTIAILLVVLFNTTVIAQDGRGQGRRNMDPKELAERMTSQMKESLKLTEAQLPQVEALNLKYAEKMSAARAEASGDREVMRGKMRTMMQEKDVELKKILTAEQWTKFEADRKERMQNRRGGSGRRGI